MNNPTAHNKSKITGKVLIMDDDDEVREILKKMLEKLHIKVVSTNKGENTIEEYIQSIDDKAPFDLVILDLIVPDGMGGKETIDKLIEIDPGVKAVVCSGYSNDPVMSNYKDYGFKNVIKKPFTIDELKKIVISLI